MEKRILGQENFNLNSRQFKSGGSPFINSKKGSENLEKFYETFKSSINEEELANLQKAIQRIHEELNKIQDELNK